MPGWCASGESGASAVTGSTRGRFVTSTGGCYTTSVSGTTPSTAWVKCSNAPETVRPCLPSGVNEPLPLRELGDRRLAGVETAAYALEGVIAHVADANRRVLELAVATAHGDSSQLDRVGYFRSLHAGRQPDHRHGR